jgi:large subunit ribosomal protein L17
MLHGNKTKQLGRGRNQRSALLKTLAVSLIKNEKISTSVVKAKIIRSFVEKLITIGKAGDLSAQKLLAQKVGPVSATKIVKVLAPKYIDRKGGYTRVIKLKTRLSDATKMAQVEFV